MTRLAIIGTMGLPAKYGGFETLTENLVIEAERQMPTVRIAVYCSGKCYDVQPAQFRGAQLRYLPFWPNGLQSVVYDIASLFDAKRKGDDVALVLGVSGAVALPFLRIGWGRSPRVITNIDGIEWRREKWGALARAFLRFSERIAVRWSDQVVVDNASIAEYVAKTYARDSAIITYGGDQAVRARPSDIADLSLPPSHALALCRIEPENNVAMILEAFSQMPDHPLVFVGNWEKGEYGRRLKAQYQSFRHIRLLDPIYDGGRLRAVRNGARQYIHGHSAGGTNPSLVEMMHFGIPVLAFDCVFNRTTTAGKAAYFDSVEGLKQAVSTADAANGRAMLELAQNRYRWEQIAGAYLALISPDLEPTKNDAVKVR